MHQASLKKKQLLLYTDNWHAVYIYMSTVTTFYQYVLKVFILHIVLAFMTLQLEKVIFLKIQTERRKCFP